MAGGEHDPSRGAAHRQSTPNAAGSHARDRDDKAPGAQRYPARKAPDAGRLAPARISGAGASPGGGRRLCRSGGQSAGGPAVDAVDVDRVPVGELVAELAVRDRDAAALVETDRRSVPTHGSVERAVRRPVLPLAGEHVEVAALPLRHRPDRRVADTRIDTVGAFNTGASCLICRVDRLHRRPIRRTQRVRAGRGGLCTVPQTSG